MELVNFRQTFSGTLVDNRSADDYEKNLQNSKVLDFFLTVRIEPKLLQDMSGLTLICFQCHLIFTNDKKLYFEKI